MCLGAPRDSSLPANPAKKLSPIDVSLPGSSFFTSVTRFSKFWLSVFFEIHCNPRGENKENPEDDPSITS